MTFKDFSSFFEGEFDLGGIDLIPIWLGSGVPADGKVSRDEVA
jgi:hypothetical protein